MNRLVVSDDGTRILATTYQSGEATPLAVVELTVEQAVTLTAELTAAVSHHLAMRAEYRREP
jgi:hypothetical protein